MPILTTDRLVIRPLVEGDLDAVDRILADGGDPAGQAVRRRWLRWTASSYRQLAQLDQPPYGDRGIALLETGAVVGICGFVPCLDLFARIPTLNAGQSPGLASTEFGLHWAVGQPHRGRGYATEAGRALIDYAFSRLRLDRVVATTTHDNLASIAVMRKLGMRIERNPAPEPVWLQVVGVRFHSDAAPP